MTLYEKYRTAKREYTVPQIKSALQEITRFGYPVVAVVQGESLANLEHISMILGHEPNRNWRQIMEAVWLLKVTLHKPDPDILKKNKKNKTHPLQFNDNHSAAAYIHS